MTARSLQVNQNDPAFSVAVAGFLLYILTAIGRITEVFPFLSRLSIGNIAILMIVGGLFFASPNSTASLKSNANFRLVVVFVLLAFTSLAYSIWLPMSIEFISKPFPSAVVIFFFAAKVVSNIHLLKKTVTTLALCSAFLAYSALLSYAGGRLVLESAYDPNDLALILVSLIPIVLVERSNARSAATRLFWTATASCAAAVVVLTQSRGGLVGFAVVALYLVFFGDFTSGKVGRNKLRIVKRLILLILATIMLFYIAPDDAKQRLSTIFSIEDDYNVTAQNEGRLAIWTRGLTYFASHPWGSGIASYPMVDLQMGGRFLAPHNTFVQVIVELGAIAFIVFIMLYWRSIKSLRRLAKSEIAYDDHKSANHIACRKYAVALLGTMLGHITCSMFLSHAYYPLMYLVFALAGSVAALTSTSGHDLKRLGSLERSELLNG